MGGNVVGKEHSMGSIEGNVQRAEHVMVGGAC